MSKKFGIFLIFSFLAMQAYTFLHMAEHGFGEHQHEGKTCEIYLFSKHAQYTEPKAAVVAQAVNYITLPITLPERVVVALVTHSASLPRAPPHFS